MSDDLITVQCEGSGFPGHELNDSTHLCMMCGRALPIKYGDIVDHQRPDVIAMLDRGDFG